MRAFSRFAPSLQPSPRLTAGLSLLLCLGLAACSDNDDDDDDDDVAEAGVFSATLSRDEVSANTTLGTGVRVTIRNLAPDSGTFQTPVWVGFHDGTFDIYDLGSPASAELERLAEDGNIGPLSEAFQASGAGTIEGILGGLLGPVAGPIPPGESITQVFRVDPTDTSSRYFGYASMVIPSNDAFVANANPMAHEIFDAGGNFVATDFVVAGTAVRDAGTEVNDELPVNTAFFGQATPDTGTAEGANITVHPGFLAMGMGGILDDAMFSAADFTAMGYEVFSFSFEEVSMPAEPSGLALADLAEDGTTFTYEFSGSDLSGAATALELRRGDDGETGTLVADLTSDITRNESGVLTAAGMVTLTADQAEDLEDGDLFFLAATALNADGELRGELEEVEGFSASFSTAQEVPTPVEGTGVRVVVQNRAPENGTFQTPLWVGFHDGTFDIYDLGAPSSMELERIAEDGDAAALNAAFSDSETGTQQGLITGVAGPIAPGETTSAVFRVDESASRYFGYASMVIPSNDAFIAGADPMGHEIFDAMGAFTGAAFVVDGGGVRDAGTEVNDEVPANTAFFGQMTPDTGVDEGANITVHPGFLAMGMGGILDDAMFANADFTAMGYETLAITFQEVSDLPEATGIAAIELETDDDDNEMDLELMVSGLSGTVVAFHLHEGAPGVSGPVLIDLFDQATLNAGGLFRVSAEDIELTDEIVEAIESGNTYFNIHTTLNPAGEVRAQLDAASDE